MTQNSGPQIRNQIQPRLEETPLGGGWREADNAKYSRNCVLKMMVFSFHIFFHFHWGLNMSLKAPFVACRDTQYSFSKALLSQFSSILFV